MDRRLFIQQSGLASASTMVPGFVRDLRVPPQQSRSGKILIVIQLSGGNDGLNTFVPYREDLYQRNRPGLHIGPKTVLALTDQVGLHPALADLRPQYDLGELLVINSVGYPNPTRSHFRSMDIWQTASHADQYLQTGWLGRYLDSDCFGCDQAYHAVEIGDNLGLALQGSKRDGFAMRDGNQLRRLTDNEFLHTLGSDQKRTRKAGPNLDYLYKTMIEVQESADYLIQKSKVYTSSQSYPVHSFGRGLKQIAELISADTDTRVYYISLPGFDTHANQFARQEKLLRTYSQAVAALIADLKHNKLFADTMIMTFSEFGRRVEENGSRGTDHGTANNVWLLSGALKEPGFYNDMPDLSNLVNGDLIFEIDFRRIYATLLENWLGVPPQDILLENFAALDSVV